MSRELQLAAAIDELTEHVVLFDSEDRIILANKAWKALNQDIIEFTEPGVRFEDHLRAAINKGLIPEAAGREEEWLRERLHRHFHPRGPFEVARQDGRWVLINEQRLANNAIILIVSDITGQKRVAEELRASEERFQAFIRHLPAKMHIKDPQGRYLLINPVSEQLFGVTNAEAIGKTAADIFPEHMGQAFGSHDQAVLRTGMASAAEEEFPTRDGVRTFLTVKFPIRDANGNVAAVGASGIDITDRKRAEEALKNAHRELERRVEERTRQLQREVEQHNQTVRDLKLSEERFRDIAASSSDWFWEMGPDLRFTCIDESFREIAGVDPTAYLGKSRRDLAADGADTAKWDRHLDDLANHRPFRGFQYELRRPDGTSQHISLSGTPVFGEDGEFRGYRGAGTNVTARVESERRAAAAQEQMRIARAQAEKASRAKSDFLTSMSHELRTPMNAILGFAQLLELDNETPLTERQKEYVHHLLAGGQHLLNLIADVLELNKIEAGRLSLVMDHVSARQVIRDCLLQIQLRAEESGIGIIDRSAEERLPWLWADATRLKQVLLNILMNAVKYNRQGGTVTVSCQELPERMLRIMVTDTGEGIPADRQHALFLPFDRLGREAGNIEGTGIGLTIAKRIVEMLDGRIGFESEEGKGSRFWIDIPVSEKQRADAATVDLAPTADSTGKGRAEAGVARSVLYIEDNPADMRLMETIIARLTNMRMLPAPNAELGIELARKHVPDLILMDINLPGMSGLEALAELKRTNETANIPVVAISADAMPIDIETAMKAGFRAYLTKPLNVADVHRIIANIIGS